MSPGLHILATPIGNARDISLRALDTLAVCDLVLAEDTRVTAKLFAIHGIQKSLAPYNDHNAAQVRPQILEKLRQGQRIVLVSDAGTPLVSDPGYKLVKDAADEFRDDIVAKFLGTTSYLVWSGNSLPSTVQYIVFLEPPDRGSRALLGPFQDRLRDQFKNAQARPWGKRIRYRVVDIAGFQKMFPNYPVNRV